MAKNKNDMLLGVFLGGAGAYFLTRFFLGKQHQAKLQIVMDDCGWSITDNTLPEGNVPVQGAYTEYNAGQRYPIPKNRKRGFTVNRQGINVPLGKCNGLSGCSGGSSCSC